MGFEKLHNDNSLVILWLIGALYVSNQMHRFALW